MTAYLSPVLQESQFTNDATFLAGGLVWFYNAGTSTQTIAYQDELGTVPWPNPIQLNSRGETGGTIWLASYADTGGYKIVLEGAPFYGQVHGVVIANFDGVTGVNDPTTNISATPGDWIIFPSTPAFTDVNVFSVTGDQTSIFQKYRRLIISCNAGNIGASVRASVFSGTDTAVTVVLDGGVPTIAGITAVQYGLIETFPYSSVPLSIFSGTPSSGSLYSSFMNWNSSSQRYDTYNNTTFAGSLAFLTDVNFTQNIAENGYVKFPSGLTVKWGQVTATSGITNVVFSTPNGGSFSSNCFWTNACYVNLNGTTVWPNPVVIDGTSLTASGFTILNNPSVSSVYPTMYWIAIGN